MRDIDIDLRGTRLTVTIDDIVPPTDAPKCSNPDNPAFDDTGTLGSFKIVEAYSPFYNLDNSDEEEEIYELVEDELERTGWK